MNNRIWTAGLLFVIVALACNNPALTTTPSVPVASPIDEPINCRIGPGTEWENVSSLSVGQTAPIVGRNSVSTWWYVQTPNDPNTLCWVAASVTTTAGNVSAVAVVADPTASVTAVSVAVDPQDISLPGCIGPVAPVEVAGSIHVNGPLTVQYQFETAQSGVVLTDSIVFDEFGTQTIEIDYTPVAEEGSFWIRLVIIQPGEATAETEYEIDCTP